MSCKIDTVQTNLLFESYILSKMESYNETKFIEENSFVLYNFTVREPRPSITPNWLESWLWRLEDKLGITSTNGLVIFMILYLVFLLASTLCVICCYTCLTRRRNLHRFSKNNSNRSNYVKNIQSFYSATAEVDEEESPETESGDNVDLSTIPSHLIQDVLLQDGDDISMIEDTTGNDVGLPASDLEKLDYSSFDFSHSHFDDVSRDGLKNEEKILPFVNCAQNLKTSFPNAQKNWVIFDDDSPSGSLNDSDHDVLEEELEVKMRLELNEDDDLLPSSTFDGAKSLVNLGFENEMCDREAPHPLNFSAVVASQLPF